MAPENATLAIKQNNSVLDVNMIDAVRECSDEFNWVDTLPVKMTRVKVKPKLFPVLDCFKCYLGGKDIESDFSWMYFQRKAHA